MTGRVLGIDKFVDGYEGRFRQTDIGLVRITYKLAKDLESLRSFISEHVPVPDGDWKQFVEEISIYKESIPSHVKRMDLSMAAPDGDLVNVSQYTNCFTADIEILREDSIVDETHSAATLDLLKEKVLAKYPKQEKKWGMLMKRIIRMETGYHRLDVVPHGAEKGNDDGQ